MTARHSTAQEVVDANRATHAALSEDWEDAQAVLARAEMVAESYPSDWNDELLGRARKRLETAATKLRLFEGRA